MKNTTIRLFSYAPYQYQEMENYLNTTLQEDGLKLRWCRSIFAGFEKTDQTDTQYIVDPIVASSLVYINRYPKYRMHEFMENGWYGVGKTKGCYIFRADDSSVEKPQLEENLLPNIQKTSGIWSFLFAIILSVLLFFAFTSPAMLYNILLRNLYLVLTGLVIFFVGYLIVNGLIAISYKGPRTQMCRRYVLFTAVTFLFYMSALFLELSQQTSTLFYIFLPIIILIICSALLIQISRRINKSGENNKKLMISICVIGVILTGTIGFSFKNIESSTTDFTNSRQEQLLLEVDQLPILQLSDITADLSDNRMLAKENNSIIGSNILYAEETDTLYTFSNHTEMAFPFAAQKIFDYLYMQCQVDFQESFLEKTYDGIVYYELEKANTILLMDDCMVYLVTTPENVAIDTILSVVYSS